METFESRKALEDQFIAAVNNILAEAADAVDLVEQLFDGEEALAVRHDLQRIVDLCEKKLLSRLDGT